MSALGDNVRKRRRQAGLSQLELAGAADLSPSTVAKVEQGGSCSMETLHTIARALNVKTSQLLAEDPPERERRNRPERMNLRDLRIALTPPIVLSSSAAAQPPGGRDFGPASPQG